MRDDSTLYSERRAHFRALHQRGCFLLPNPWDVGSARYLHRLGVQALATTSAGCAWSQGLPDGALSREAVLAHLRDIVQATPLPVNADFENGFGDSPEAVADSVRLAVATGVAGLSIEDSTGRPEQPVFALAEAVDRVRAARAAIDAAGGEVLLMARAENFFLQRDDLPDTLARLQAYAEAGADCLYAPGIKTPEQIAAVVQAVAPKPVNLLIGHASPLTLADAAALGVRRVSVGGALARAAWGGLMRAAGPMVAQGRFDGLADAAPGTALNALFRAD